MRADFRFANPAAASRWIVALLCLLMLVLLIVTATRSPGTPPQLGAIPDENAQALRWRWFGAAGSGGAGGAAVPQETLQEASINGTLHGVVVTDRVSFATLRMPGRGERVYAIGDEIDGGMEIIAIEPTRVVVRQNGRDMQISLPKDGLSLESSRSSLLPGGGDDVSAAVDAAGFSVSEVTVEGYEGGVSLDSLPAGLQGIGDLQDGDIIVEVQGTDIQTLRSDPSLWAQFSSSTALPVTVLRDGEPVQITVNAQGLMTRLLPSMGGSPNP